MSETDLANFENYDFENDLVFQNGLSSMQKKSNLSPEAINKAKIFYYNKLKKTAITLELYDEIKKQENSINTESNCKPKDLEAEELPEDLTFAEVVERISKNQTIGGIRDIPLELSEDAPSEPKLAPIKKPWEQ